MGRQVISWLTRFADRLAWQQTTHVYMSSLTACPPGEHQACIDVER